jgi:hypothetical protein
MSNEYASAVTTGSRAGGATGFELASPHEPTPGNLDVRSRATARSPPPAGMRAPSCSPTSACS